MRKILSSILLITLLFAGCDNSNDPYSPPPATLTKLDIEPKISQLDIGTTQHYTAVATYSNGDVSDVSDQVTWSLDNNSGIIVPVNDPDYPGLKFAEAVKTGTDNLVATLSPQTASASVTVVDAALVSLLISPTESNVPIGAEVTYIAEGTYDDGHTQDLTEESDWSAFNGSAANVVSITGKGVISAVNEGTVQIKATNEMLDSNTANITVHDPKEIVFIDVNPTFTQLFVGSSQQLNAYAFYSDGSFDFITSSALWTSSDTTVAAQEPFIKARFNALSVGSAVITAQFGSVGYEGTALITVEEKVLEDIIISPQNVSLAVGETRKYFTEAVASDGSYISINGSTEQSYSVSDPSIAYISNLPDNKGQLQGLKAGTTSVISTFNHEGNTYKDETTVTVTP